MNHIRQAVMGNPLVTESVVVYARQYGGYNHLFAMIDGVETELMVMPAIKPSVLPEAAQEGGSLTLWEHVLEDD